MTTKFDTLTDSEIDAAVAVRVEGWHRNPDKRSDAWYIHCGHGKIEVTMVVDRNWSPATCLDACFAAQTALAAKGERYWHYYCVFAVPEAAWQNPLYGWQNWLDTAATLALDARTRCIAMLLAVDAVEGVRE